MGDILGLLRSFYRLGFCCYHSVWEMEAIEMDAFKTTSRFKDDGSGQYTVDKTLFIRDVMRDPSVAILFLRPRGFCKTSNLDMLKAFLEKTDSDNSIYFRNRKICKEEVTVREHFGKYPVIYMSFKSLDGSDAEAIYAQLAEVVASEYRRHGELEDSAHLSEKERKLYLRTVQGKLGRIELESSLFMLSYMLKRHYEENVMILIDDYDLPVTYASGFLEDMLSFMRVFLGQALKTNPYLKKGILTGVSRIANDGFCNGINNVVTYSMLDDRYSEYFGFTEEEIVEAARYHGCEDRLAELEKWYNGYIVGSRRIYNPWSVARYFNIISQESPSSLMNSGKVEL